MEGLEFGFYWRNCSTIANILTSQFSVTVESYIRLRVGMSVSISNELLKKHTINSLFQV